MSPHFIGELDLRPLPDGRNFQLALAFGFWTPRTGLISVPPGFRTDLASIPQLFWNILPPFGKYTQAAVIHDFAYRTRICDRKTADWLLLAGMRLCRVPVWQRVVIYCAVRIFGGVAWRDDSRLVKLAPHHGHVSYGPKNSIRET